MTSAAPEPTAAADVLPLPIGGAPSTPPGPPISSLPPTTIAPAPEPATQRARTLAPAALAMIGGFVMVVAAFMPWAVLVGSGDYERAMTGFDLQESGLVVLAIGVVAAGFGAATIAIRGHAQFFIRRVPIIIGLGAIGHAAYRIQWVEDWARWGVVASRSINDWVAVSVGLGLYTLILGAALVFVAGCWPKPR